ncbi:MAG: (d)CMP kinase [Acidimicrobiales bacterium]|nr:(d)CMP kinase [Acidimicrobiales bacterium]
MSQEPSTTSQPGPSEQLTVVAIDGPAGSGKSTVARLLAERVGLPYLDTGAMYRAVTFACIAAGIDPADADEATEVAREMDLRMDPDGTVMVNLVDATTQIRGPAVTRAVSSVAAHPGVRTELVSRQREWARRRGGGVLEGRDIGTVVFPDATLVVYLTASAEVRAARRAGEVTDLDYDTVAADIARRDAFDQSRDADPLRRADGALEVDTTYLTIDEVLDVLQRRLDGARSGPDR